MRQLFLDDLIDAGWDAPNLLPTGLKDERTLYVDLETSDPLLTELGPSWTYDQGHIAGVAVGTEDREWYIPLNHEGCAPPIAPAKVMAWLADALSGEGVLVAHNATYELGWLASVGIRPRRETVCTMATAALLNELARRYGLDGLCADAGLPGKEEGVLRDAAKLAGLDPKKDLWKLDPRFVGQYGEGDIRSMRGLWRVQRALIDGEGIRDVWKLEMDLMPMWAAMRAQGVRIDVEGAGRLKDEWDSAERDALRSIRTLHGVELSSVWKAEEVAALLKKVEGAVLPLTPKGEPEIRQPWLKARAAAGSQLCTDLLNARRFSKASGTFIESLLRFEHRGRVYPEWRPLKSDEGGTVSGRVSATKPGGQLWPSPEKNPEFGIPLRKLFLPEEGDRWLAADYSQQEPRLAVHYGIEVFGHFDRVPRISSLMSSLGVPLRGGRGRSRIAKAHRLASGLLNSAQEAAAAYAAGVDLHQRVADQVSTIRPIGRPAAKIVNLGLLYGEGARALAPRLGVSEDESREIVAAHARMVPFLRQLSYVFDGLAAERGFIRTIGGRKCRFLDWEPTIPPFLRSEGVWGYIRSPILRAPAGERPDEVPDEALAEWTTAMCDWARKEGSEEWVEAGRPKLEAWLRDPSNLTRAFTYRALNRVIQGSAADQCKLAMREQYRAGLLPLLQMHDELDHSVGSQKEIDTVNETMMDAVALRCPVKVDLDVGPTWGEAT